ncbi:MAG: Asp-tRNA(Asn)/Glu-tRNA(Gln) amidotransferase subunit GatA [bacterium]|nr:Asp-tRNA(Asn)/Glu-tRNA(Gln) amidotransferase subunit GatA [bacterium]
MTDPARLSASGIRARLDEGRASSVELTRACLERVRRADGELGAFVRLNPEAEREAEEADRLIREGRAGPLTGIPVAVKDNINTAGLETGAGSSVLAGFVPLRDATVVARLRRAGAVVLGKTNLDEFGMGSSTENSAHGPTRNPNDLERVPGGSSGGSAVAVAAGMAPLALGSDTGGSVRQPAAFCGVVGIKPTYGRVSRSGLIAFASSLDQVGVFAADVEGAALLLDGISGEDAGDQTSLSTDAPVTPATFDGDAHGLRVGIPREYVGAGLDAGIRGGIDAAADALSAAGAAVEEVSLPHTRYAVPTYYLIATAEASSNLSRYDGVRFGARSGGGGGGGGGGDLPQMYRGTRTQGFGPEVQRRILLGTFALSSGYYDAFYGKAQRARTLVRRDFEELFDRGVDLLLTPTTPTPAFRLGEKLDDPVGMYLSDVYTVTASLAGLPALSLPVGLTGDGLPMACQLIGSHLGEATVFRAAFAIESRLTGTGASDA